MELSVQEIEDFNVLSHWLAEDELEPGTPDGVQLIILAGNAIIPEIEGAMALASKLGIPLLLSGGVGHSTELLRSALALNAHYDRIGQLQSGEADLLEAMAISIYKLQPEQVMSENLSRNCGENALFSLNFLKNAGKIPARYLLVQDPLMQRRTKETYRFQWGVQGVHSECISWPVFTPRLESENSEVTIAGSPHTRGIWSLNRYLSMVMGEMVRLQDDEKGYGPKGKGFIGKVNLPDEVERAWRRLMQNPALAGLSR